jgi:hypothetical protein
MEMERRLMGIIDGSAMLLPEHWTNIFRSGVCWGVFPRRNAVLKQTAAEIMRVAMLSPSNMQNTLAAALYRPRDLEIAVS